MNARTARQGLTSPQDEASHPTQTSELGQHCKVVHGLMNDLRGELVRLLPRLPSHESKKLVRPLRQNLALVVASFSLESTTAINGELTRQIEDGAAVLGQVAQLIDWASDMGYLGWDDHERIVKRVQALMLGAFNLKWFLSQYRSMAGRRRTQIKVAT
jgi:hypothetical protein